jgi:23S rRNA (uracil1939-C5)-methyltransferase
METRTAPPRTRRRITLAARRLVSGAILGFNERAGSRIVDLAECHVASPTLESLLPPLRDLVATLTCLGAADILATETDTGIDLLIAPTDAASPGLAEREALAAFAETHDLARLSWRADGFLEPLAARRAPRVAFGGVPVEIPIGAFLQPSAAGQTILTSLVEAGVPRQAERVADLYSGCGAFALPFAAAGRRVHAAEGQDAAVQALRRAAAGLRLTAEVRDLARAPLSVEELAGVDAVVFDPPRAGAAAQAERIAASPVETVVAVSCNPATLARDLRTLLDGGYTLERVTPVDQFTWSAHVEAVAILRRS